MGVKDLWKILESAGHPITLESLEGLILAVDVSIWLNQAVKGARDRHGEMLKGAHLAVLFSRICKLLHYRIKPVFVFDGPPPMLKLQTLCSRNQRRRASSQKLLKNADKQLSKYLQASILSQVTGEKGSLFPRGPTKPTEDLFWLPPLSDQTAEEGKRSSSAHDNDGDGTGGEDDDLNTDCYHQEMADLDVHSEEFACLPPETQHDLLLEKQRYEKYTYHHPSTLPQVADDFSNYQLARLVKRNRISEKLEMVRHVLKSGEAAVTVGDMTKVHHVETNRVVSSDHTHYILVKGSGLESSKDDTVSQSDVYDKPLQYDAETIQIPEGVKPSYVDNTVTSLEHSPDHVRHCEEGDMDLLAQVQEDAANNSNYSTPSTIMTNAVANPPALIPCSRITSKVTNSLSLATSSDSPPVLLTTAMAALPVATSRIDSNMETVAPPSDGVPLDMRISTSRSDQDEKELCNSMWEGPGEYVGMHRPPASEGTKDNFGGLLNQAGPTLLSSAAIKPTLAAKNSAEFISSSDEEIEDMTEVTTPSSHTVLTEVSGMKDTAAGPFVLDVDSTTPAKGSSLSAAASVTGQEMEDLMELPVGVAREQVRKEVEMLEEERNRQKRDEAAVESHMYQDARELLTLFGIPYVLSPGEAEAQCATLELLNLTNGTITDDSDVFLFGGTTVYRHFFSQDHHPEKYIMDEIKDQLGLSRDRLVALAYVLGSDYSEGLEGIGTVLATEFLDEFKVNNFRSLEAFKEWHRNIPLGVNQTTPLKRKLSQLVLPHGFPNEAIKDAYFNPRVDQSTEVFNWAKPDLDLIRKYAATNIGWSSEKVDGILLPVIKKLNAPESQLKISRFISLHHSPGEKMAAMSKRMRKAVGKLRSTEDAKVKSSSFGGISSSGSDSDEASTSQPKRRRGKEKVQGSTVGKSVPVSEPPEQKSVGQGLESSDSDSEFNRLAKEIIQQEQKQSKQPLKRGKRGKRGRR